MMLLSALSYSQNNNPTHSKWIFKLGANLVDNSGDTNPFNGLDLKKMGFSNNIAVGVDYQFHKKWSIGAFISNNKFKSPNAELDGVLITEDMNYFATDVNLKYYVLDAFKKDLSVRSFNMYLSGGLGLFNIVDPTLSLNFGGGIVYWFDDSFGIILESIAKFTTESNVQYDSNHFQHFVGITYRPTSKKDTDGDGILDENDECPNNFGLQEFNGCPDSDNDGLIDTEDHCPNTAGLKKYNGCPDADNDGVVNSQDKCPNTFGPKQNKGCPYKDTDQDGIYDKDDACPTVKGVQDNNGCPQPRKSIKKEEKSVAEINAILKNYAKVILFETGKHELTIETTILLDEIVNTLKLYPNASIVIEGHTDNVGAAHINKVLSQKRADAIKAYLVKNSVIKSENIEAIGYGETKPRYANETKETRKLNRRVVVRVQ